MHDLEFEHLHVTADDAAAVNEVAWAADNVELTTVGIDIGSSTAHLMFARVHLQRLATGLSSRFLVAQRDILWRSPIALTPYRPDYTIDAEALAAFLDDCYDQAGLAREQVDTGAVILTGEALKRHNAAEIAGLFAAEGGRFVCASAGHHLEAALSANGSGAVALSRRERNTILNIDVGGGTTKFALVREGRILATSAIAVGGRLIVEREGRLVRLEDPIARVARAIGLSPRLGEVLNAGDRARLVGRMAELIVAIIDQRPPDALGEALMLTDPLPETPRPDALTFSGGVAEYIFEREGARFGDLGLDLAEAIRRAAAERRLPAPIWDAGQGIRATVIGASQFTAQISGNTIFVPEPGVLPLRNLTVLACHLPSSEVLDSVSIAAELRARMVQADHQDGGGPASSR